MEKLVGTGKVKAIGSPTTVSSTWRSSCRRPPSSPQPTKSRTTPTLPQQEIVDFCKQKGIHITAYSPLGSTGSPLFTAEPIVSVANKRGVTPATVLLSWHSK